MTDTPPGAEFRLAEMAPKRRAQPLVVIGAIALVLLAGGGVTAFALTRNEEPPATSTPAPASSTASEAPSATPSANPPASPSPKTYSAVGAISIITEIQEDGASCRGKGKNSDVVEGARLSILDASGNRIAESKLGPGALDGLACTFLFTVQNVPAGKGTYRVAVANRKSREYTEADFYGTTLNIML